MNKQQKTELIKAFNLFVTLFNKWLEKQATYDEWQEEKHKRDKNGRFAKNGSIVNKIYKSKDITQDDLNNLEQSFESGDYSDFTEYEKFIDDTLNSMQAKGQVAFVGNLPFKVTRYYTNIGINLESALTGIIDHSLLHMKRDSKEKRNATLRSDEIKAIPAKIHSKDTLWFYDKNNKSIVMAFVRFGNEYAKVIIKPNRKLGKGIGNEIITGGKISKENLLQIKDNEKI